MKNSNFIIYRERHLRRLWNFMVHKLFDKHCTLFSNSNISFSITFTSNISYPDGACCGHTCVTEKCCRFMFVSGSIKPTSICKSSEENVAHIYVYSLNITGEKEYPLLNTFCYPFFTSRLSVFTWRLSFFTSRISFFTWRLSFYVTVILIYVTVMLFYVTVILFYVRVIFFYVMV